MGFKFTTAQFAELIKSVHDGRCEFIDEYRGMASKSWFKCKHHGEFYIKCQSFLKSSGGCPKCGHILGGNKNIVPWEEYLQKVNKIYNGKYQYDALTYEGTRKKLSASCPIHGKFFVYTYDHLNGHECAKCTWSKAMSKHIITKEFFIKESTIVHSNKYDYSKITDLEFKNLRQRVTIKCPIHKIDFIQTIGAHLKGSRCRKCAYEERNIPTKISHDKFLERARLIHGNRYKYIGKYNGMHKSISILCQKHGKFSQIPATHLSGSGCPSCNISNGERAVYNYLKYYGIKYIQQKRFLDCKYKMSLPFDFYLPDVNVCIEYQGEQHYLSNGGGVGFYKNKDFDLIRKRDAIKRRYCIDKDIKLIEIPYWEQKNIKSILKKELNLKNKMKFTISYLIPNYLKQVA